MLWRGPGGIEVEAIILDDWPRLRVSRWTPWGRFWVAYCRTPDEVAEHVALEDLVEVYQFPGRAGGSGFRRLV